MEIFLICITILSVIISIICITNKRKVDTQTDIINQNIKQQNIELNAIYSNLYNNITQTKEECTRLKIEHNLLSSSIKKEQEYLQSIQESAKQSLDTQTELSRQAFENYCDILTQKYKEVEQEHNEDINNLKEIYANIQLELMAETDEIKIDLDKMKATHSAIIEANRREKEIENNLSFYCIDIADTDKSDIARLETLKPSLNKPRVLSMLIWQTWFLKPLKTLSANVIGPTDKTGIYKITNIKTKECYIGQAVSIRDRWVEHAKCGLGIDTPAGNKLYKAMQEFGLWNFSFEVLEECSREQLNEKERYYINLYNSCDYGMNSNKGNK